ncbi:hypothetical protein A3A46_01655 [Candidatus Roizmanbacteria bacterium RIFCSPLOWO2_01_FULL_37_13]|uniref:Uncharacterized protein n=1 Tax=Candidatus Roizmanbacteria bacterium RIFCSPHIGHO2_02_FULL_38_11 TaxID=1802039 RepID=A0A1F7H0J1_9BACT|nr:MAG: hypothetical protein A3C25_05895 [Candidatus Roizmanbacteria bacterium RIFCSPHIGHO2_02_FULL_38_11]OGK32826.1 MAG: hypothetical protein A3F58_00085 [Candidatus Roizmanbacteria bacterium RIFCSPHIGHO2_12_FULL_37_9b]OGK42571.1 MAG: hypothetical protein A3A46_01655 [Candidatus Roizmanbacteria bacterium RIFCSPLOWO2_01_FULL_37_13]
MKNIKVHSVFRDYEVEFIEDLKGLIKSLNKNYRTHYLIDQGVWKFYKAKLEEVKKGNSIYPFEAVESKKTLEEVLNYVKFLLEKKVQKKDVIVVIGGGLVQDIGSFTAHILKRGVEWIFIPTTLLAIADSCIGSKSGINVGKYKNQVGSFHPPSHIYIYSAFLKTLPKLMILDGIGEIVKHALLKGGKSYKSIKDNLRFLPSDIKKSEKVIYDSLLIKKEIVEEDELEKNIRRLLNYGHSFGHALEGYTKNAILHGVAVTIGMDMANYISMKRGFISQKEFAEISKVLRDYIPYKELKIDDLDTYMEFLSRDKKVVGEELNAILCKGIGKIKIIKVKLNDQLRKELQNYLAYFNE